MPFLRVAAAFTLNSQPKARKIIKFNNKKGEMVKKS